jgi:hypothetical protein
VRGNDVRSTAYKRVATIGSEDHRGRQRRFEESIEVGETFNVQHVDLSHSVGMGRDYGRKAAYFVNKDNTRNNFRHPLVDIALDDLVNLSSQLFCHLSPAALYETAHDAHNVLPALWPRIRRIKVAKRDVLNKFLALVDITFGKGNVSL